MSDLPRIKLDYGHINTDGYHPTPHEFVLNWLGYIPDGTPDTWEKVDPMIRRFTLDGIIPPPKWGIIPTFDFH